MSELCPHGRIMTAFCEPCSQLQLESETYLSQEELAEKVCGKIDEKVTQPKGPYPGQDLSDFYDIPKQPSGLDAPYYNIPDDVHTMQDMIEWLELDFGNGNILKSIVREYNPDAQKETTELYEAEKRFYYASRHLRRVRAMQEKLSGGE